MSPADKKSRNMKVKKLFPILFLVTIILTLDVLNAQGQRSEILSNGERLIVWNVESGGGRMPPTNLIENFDHSTRINASGSINISDEDFYKGKSRTHKVSLPGISFIPIPRKGNAFKNYFKSLNSSDENIYFLITSKKERVWNTLFCWGFCTA